MNPAKLAARIDSAGNIIINSVKGLGSAWRPRLSYISPPTENERKGSQTEIYDVKARELAPVIRPFLIVKRKQQAMDEIINLDDRLYARRRIQGFNASRTTQPPRSYPSITEESRPNDLQYLSGLLDCRVRVTKQGNGLTMTTPDAELVVWMRSKVGGRAWRDGVYPATGFLRWRWSQSLAEAAAWLPGVLDLVEEPRQSQFRLALKTVENRPLEAAPLAEKRRPHPNDNRYRALRRKGQSREDAASQTGVTLERAEWIDFANGYGSL